MYLTNGFFSPLIPYAIVGLSSEILTGLRFGQDYRRTIMGIASSQQNIEKDTEYEYMFRFQWV